MCGFIWETDQGCTSTSQTDDSTATTDLTDILYWYFVLVPAKCTKFRKVFLIERFQQEGGLRVCGIALLGYFWCGIAVIFISKYGIAVFRVQAVCGKFKFHVAVVGKKSLCRGDLLLFHDKRILILNGLPS